MGVAITLQEYLDFRHINYELIKHSHTDTPSHAATAAQIPSNQMAKPVLLGDDHSYLLVVIPASHRLELARLNQLMARGLEVIHQNEAKATFNDCEPGALPAIGEAYGVDTLLDASLAHEDDIYFECGDHEHLVHMSGEDFRKLMGEAQRVHASHHL